VWRPLNFVNILRTEFPHGWEVISILAYWHITVLTHPWSKDNESLRLNTLGGCPERFLQHLRWPLFEPLLTCVESIGDGNISFHFILFHFISFHPQNISKVMTNGWCCNRERVSNLMNR
jgi:hypothetical protein